MAIPQMTVLMPAPHASLAPPAPDPEVAATAKRRQFSSHEKRRILAVADRCTEVGKIGALLRREGLYSSQLATWRKQREVAERAARTKENERLRRKLQPSRPSSMSKKTLHRTRVAHGRGSGGDILMSALHVFAPEIGLASACAA